MSVRAKKSYKEGGKVYKKGGKFPDLNKDGKVTMADVLKGKGVRGKKKVVAQGADKADLRAERKYDRIQRKKKRSVTKGKAEGEKSKTTRTSVGDRTRTVIKQKNKSADGVRSTRKTVYGPDKGNIVTKEKQRTNRKGKKAGMISFKEKTVDRKDFTEKNKRK